MIIDWFKRKRVFIFASLCVCAVFSAGWLFTMNQPVWKMTNSPPSAIYKIQTKKPLIALTFDISWGEKRTTPILDVLKNKQVSKATFFLSSPWSQSHPDIVKRIVDDGFEIGSHGHKHLNYSELSDNDIQKQIVTADQILKQVTGKKPNLIRLPNGDFDERVLKIAQKLNYQVIQWDTDSHDWMNKGVDSIVHRVLTKAHPGDIILMHASDSCKQTHEALPIIIDRLREKGYQFVTVSELIHHTDVDIKLPKLPATSPPIAKPAAT